MVWALFIFNIGENRGPDPKPGHGKQSPSGWRQRIVQVFVPGMCSSASSFDISSKGFMSTIRNEIYYSLKYLLVWLLASRCWCSRRSYRVSARTISPFLAYIPSFLQLSTQVLELVQSIFFQLSTQVTLTCATNLLQLATQSTLILL